MRTVKTASGAEIPAVFRGYRLLEHLGSGAMGSVYRARVESKRPHLQPGELVAVKVLEQRLSVEPHAVRRFKREAGVGLGASHPNLCRVYEVGLLSHRSGRIHYIVQELLTGRSIKDWLSDGPPFPENLVRSIGAQVARALAFVHRKGVIHRDLKPANLFLDEAGHVTVVDFGLARLAGEVNLPRPELSGPLDLALTSTGRFLGTVAYAAPEQLAGRAASKKSDLFALGLSLYEMATGRHPFASALRAGLDAYLKAMQTQEAPALTRWQPEATFFLERALRTLLERIPEQRFASAEQLAEVLDAGENSPWWQEAVATESRWISESRRLLSVQRRTRMVGRDGELARLKEKAEILLQSGQGSLVWIEGEAGIGKTRLLDQLAEWVEEGTRSAYLLVIRCSSASIDLPLYPVELMLRTALQFEGATPLSQAHLEEQLRHYLPRRRQAREALGRHLLRATLESELSEGRLLGLFVDLLQAVAHERPTLLVVENVHLADPGTVELLREVAGKLSERALLVVMTCRPEEPSLPASRSGLRDLRQQAETLELSPLRGEELAIMLQDLALPLQDPPRAAKRLMSLCDGNPWFALLLIDHLRAQDALSQLERSVPLSSALPSDLEELFAEMHSARTPAEKAYLETAAVLGGSFRMTVLQSVLGMPAVPFAGLGTRMFQLRLLESVRAHQLRFRHEAYRRFILRHIDPDQRRRIHRQVAAYYDQESRTPNAPARAALKAALHAEFGGDRGLLRRHLGEAIEQLSREGQWERAFRMSQETLELAGAPPEDEELLLQGLLWQGHLAHRLGRRDREASVWKEAIVRATRRGDRELLQQAYRGLGRLHARTGRFLAAESAFLAALEHQAAARSGRAMRSLILLDLAESHFWAGDRERCAATLDEAEQCFDEGSPVQLRARYCKERGNLLIDLERLDEARQVLRRGRALVRGGPHRALYRAILLATARLFRELCEHEKVLRAAGLAERSARADRDQRHEMVALLLRGTTHLRQGSLRDARRELIGAARIARRVEDEYLRVAAWNSLCELHRTWEPPHLARATRLARRMVAASRGLAVGRMEVKGLAALALCYRQSGRSRWALSISAKAVREVEALEAHRKDTAETYVAHALILRDLGRSLESDLFRDRALGLLEDRIELLGRREDRDRVRRLEPLLKVLQTLA